MRAVVNIDGDEAELDIHQVSAPHPNPILALLGRRADYRGRGLGTHLLRYVSAELKRHGIHVLKGRVHGDDLERLKRWYRREGFVVDDATGEIRKVL